MNLRVFFYCLYSWLYQLNLGIDINFVLCYNMNVQRALHNSFLLTSSRNWGLIYSVLFFFNFSQKGIAITFCLCYNNKHREKKYSLELNLPYKTFNQLYAERRAVFGSFFFAKKSWQYSKIMLYYIHSIDTS